LRGTHAILFVCLGNICRSPLALWVVRDLARERGVLDRLSLDSCGTGSWHAGGPADPRSMMIAQAHGHETSHVARQLGTSDGERFDLLLAMDISNARTMIARGVPEAKVRRFREFDPLAVASGDLDVPDPYHGGDEGFRDVYAMIRRAADGLLDTLA
jgi:protein-tyrosine phosphatase